MQFPNNNQVALLYDGAVTNLDAMVRTFQQVYQAQTGMVFNVPESKSGVYHRLFGAGEMMVVFEYVANPANPDLFRAALGSPFTGMMCPDVRERITRSRSLVLVNVSHGVLGGVADDPKIAAMFEQLGMRKEGASLPEFRRRLEALALAGRIVNDLAPASLVHWTQSDQLIPGEMFDDYAQGGVPGPLHIHPVLFSDAKGPDGKPLVGLDTFGMRHFIGAEVTIKPNVLPWAANYQTICAFLNVALADNGYIIPDGDTFGPEDRSQSYRVLHRGPNEQGVPIYELVPLKFVEFGFLSDDHVPDEQVIDDRFPPPELMPEDQEDKQDLANEWREKRAMAEGIGGRFEVRSREAPAGGFTPPPPSGPGGGSPSGPASDPAVASPNGFRRAVFGRRGVS